MRLALPKKEYRQLRKAAEAMYNIHEEQCCTCNEWEAFSHHRWHRTDFREWLAMAAAARAVR